MTKDDTLRLPQLNKQRFCSPGFFGDPWLSYEGTLPSTWFTEESPVGTTLNHWTMDLLEEGANPEIHQFDMTRFKRPLHATFHKLFVPAVFRTWVSIISGRVLHNFVSTKAGKTGAHGCLICLIQNSKVQQTWFGGSCSWSTIKPARDVYTYIYI